MRRIPNTVKALFPIFVLILASLACVQDCIGITFNVEGSIIDINNNPIPNAKIRTWNDGSFEKPAFELQTITDDNGNFKTASAFSYACTPFKVEVSAEGYQTKTFTYYPPGEGFSDELPSSITVQLRSN